MRVLLLELELERELELARQSEVELEMKRKLKFEATTVAAWSSDTVSSTLSPETPDPSSYSILS